MCNDKTKKRAYYAFPMKRQTMHIQYWKDMLAEAGFKESDIPKTWKAYFDFWCGKAQEGYRKKTGKRIYSVGSPMGVDSSDSFYSFLTYMDAYNVKLVDDNGKLNVDQQGERARAWSTRCATTPTPSARAARRPPPSTGRTRTTTSPSTTRRS